jgi:cytochrome c5
MAYPHITHSSAAILATALLAVSFGAQATSTPDRSGKEVVDSVCIACHGIGKDGAPRIGNKAEWSKHAAQGLKAMTANAITGVRKMPAHGGQGNLTDLEMSRAVAYMVSEGAAAEPNKPYSSPQQWSGEQIVSNRCGNCHTTGQGGAPRIGNMSEWVPRLKNGLDNLVKSSIRGHNSMPARGGLDNLSDADMKAAISHMANLPPPGAAK